MLEMHGLQFMLCMMWLTITQFMLCVASSASEHFSSVCCVCIYCSPLLKYLTVQDWGILYSFWALLVGHQRASVVWSTLLVGLLCIRWYTVRRQMRTGETEQRAAGHELPLHALLRLEDGRRIGGGDSGRQARPRRCSWKCFWSRPFIAPEASLLHSIPRSHRSSKLTRILQCIVKMTPPCPWMIRGDGGWFTS